MVNEQEAITPTQTATTAPNIEAGNVVKTDDMLARADALGKRLEDAEARIKEQVDRYERIAARMILGGKSEAGMPMKTKEQEIEEQTTKEASEIANRFAMTRR